MVFSFPVVDWLCLFIYLWVLTFPLLDCSEFGNFVITLIHWDVSSSAVPTLRQWSRCCQQNAWLLYWLQFTATSWCSDPLHGWYFCCCTTSVPTTLHHPSSVQRCDHHFSLRLPAKQEPGYLELFHALIDRCQANQLQMAVDCSNWFWRQRTSSSNSSVWSTHRPPGVLLPLYSSHLEEDTAA